jgi:hypothetical protein
MRRCQSVASSSVRPIDGRVFGAEDRGELGRNGARTVHYNVCRVEVFRPTSLFCIRFRACGLHGIQLARLLRTILSERCGAFCEMDALALRDWRRTMRTIEDMKSASTSRAARARRENA